MADPAHATPSPGTSLARAIAQTLPRNVLLLGAVSFLTDVSSEMTLTILPLFLANVLGVAPVFIGLIEGIADATASLTRIFSGWLSDRLGRRKALAVAGYGLSAVSKPVLYFASAWGLVLAVRFSDRLGKGIRTAPRDALIADSVAPQLRGLSFGFHRAADTAGAFLGLGLVALIIFLSQRGSLQLERATFQTLVLVATAPGLLAVALLAWLVREPRPVALKPQAAPPALAPRGLGRPFLGFLGVSTLFALGNSSDAFLLLRAQHVGLSALQVALLLMGFNFVYAVLATPAGALSDRLGRRGVILTGWGLYALVYLGFALAGTGWQVWALFALYGVYYALAEGTGRALVADLVPADRRGTAFGAYHFALGVTALPSSLIAGALWQVYGPPAPFYFGAALALLAALLLAAWLPRMPRTRVTQK
ncbi:MAG: MFS transporter [Chloroflexi bacterium]|nr:MFS transporter [Chloroflexota bacterium]